VSGCPVKIARPCGFAGCTVLTRARLGFCDAHYSVAWPCAFDESCKHRCAAHSRTKLCQEHKWYAHKLRVERLAARLGRDGEE
jgi:hypothetical protein